MTVGIDLAWTKMINPEVVAVTDNTLCLKQTPTEAHINHNGDMHAAVLFSMSEMAGMGLVVMLLGELAKDALIVVKNVNIDFIARASGPITFVGRMNDEQKNRAIDNANKGLKVEELIQVEAKDSTNHVVSKAIVSTYIGPKKA